MLNDISITAIPEWEKNSVKIALYKLNFSNFDTLGGYNNRLQQYTPYLTIGDDAIKHEQINLDKMKKLDIILYIFKIMQRQVK